MNGMKEEEQIDDDEDYTRDSYSELRKRYGVDNSEVNCFPYILFQVTFSSFPKSRLLLTNLTHLLPYERATYS